jgi:hypothetical protein
LTSPVNTPAWIAAPTASAWPISTMVADVLRGTGSEDPHDGSPGDADTIEDILYEHLCRHAGVRPRLDARELLRSARS